MSTGSGPSEVVDPILHSQALLGECKLGGKSQPPPERWELERWKHTPPSQRSLAQKHDGHWENGRELALTNQLTALLESAETHGYPNRCQDCYSGNYNYLLSTRDIQVIDIITQFGYVFTYTIPVFWQHRLSRIIILASTSCCFLRLLNSSVAMPGLHTWPTALSPLKNLSFTWKPRMELCIWFPNLMVHAKAVRAPISGLQGVVLRAWAQESSPEGASRFLTSR